MLVTQNSTCSGVLIRERGREYSCCYALSDFFGGELIEAYREGNKKQSTLIDGENVKGRKSNHAMRSHTCLHSLKVKHDFRVTWSSVFCGQR